MSATSARRTASRPIRRRAWLARIRRTKVPGRAAKRADLLGERTFVDIARINSGTLSTALTQKRRVMSTSSGIGTSSATTVRGSKAMPHIGQTPGLSSGRSLGASGTCIRFALPVPLVPRAPTPCRTLDSSRVLVGEPQDALDTYRWRLLERRTKSPAFVRRSMIRFAAAQ